MKIIWTLTTAVIIVLAASSAVTIANAADAPAAATTKEPSYADRIERGKQIAGAVCVACHGLDGYSPIPANPNIAGMPAEYIAKQLALYKTGKRQNAIMQGMVANLTPADMNALGTYYFSQRGKTAAVARDKALAERGQKIYRVGVPEAKVPACAGCHGSTGAGIPALYPKLAGQWQDYTLHELQEYASGERKNAQMNTIASRMKPADLVAVAEYIAGMRSAK